MRAVQQDAGSLAWSHLSLSRCISTELSDCLISGGGDVASVLQQRLAQLELLSGHKRYTLHNVTYYTRTEIHIRDSICLSVNVSRGMRDSAHCDVTKGLFMSAMFGTRRKSKG